MHPYDLKFGLGLGALVFVLVTLGCRFNFVPMGGSRRGGYSWSTSLLWGLFGFVIALVLVPIL